MAVRAGWRRTGIRAAEGLGARELGPRLLITCREIARGGNTTHPLWGVTFHIYSRDGLMYKSLQDLEYKSSQLYISLIVDA